MSEPTRDPAAEDDIRQHTQVDTEGGDVTDQDHDVPREHTEDPAEG